MFLKTWDQMKSTVFLSFCLCCLSLRDGEATKRPGYSHAIPTFRESCDYCCKLIETKIIPRHTLQSNSEHVRSNPQENKQTNKQKPKERQVDIRIGRYESHTQAWTTRRRLHQCMDWWRSFTKVWTSTRGRLHRGMDRWRSFTKVWTGGGAHHRAPNLVVETREVCFLSLLTGKVLGRITVAMYQRYYGS